MKKITILCCLLIGFLFMTSCGNDPVETQAQVALSDATTVARQTATQTQTVSATQVTTAAPTTDSEKSGGAASNNKAGASNNNASSTTRKKKEVPPLTVKAPFTPSDDSQLRNWFVNIYNASIEKTTQTLQQGIQIAQQTISALQQQIQSEKTIYEQDRAAILNGSYPDEQQRQAELEALEADYTQRCASLEQKITEYQRHLDEIQAVLDSEDQLRSAVISAIALVTEESEATIWDYYNRCM